MLKWLINFLENPMLDQDLNSIIKKQKEEQHDNYEGEEGQGYGDYEVTQGYGGFPIAMVDPTIPNYQMQYGYQPRGRYPGRGRYRSRGRGGRGGRGNTNLQKRDREGEEGETAPEKRQKVNEGEGEGDEQAVAPKRGGYKGKNYNPYHNSAIASQMYAYNPYMMQYPMMNYPSYPPQKHVKKKLKSMSIKYSLKKANAYLKTQEEEKKNKESAQKVKANTEQKGN